MKKSHLGNLPVYTFSHFSGYPEIIHFSTTRNGGKSEGVYQSLNLGFHSGDEEPNVQANREVLSNALQIKPEQLVFAVQTHSASVAKINSEALSWTDEIRRENLNETDALITDKPNICIAVKTADCIPVLLYDPQRKAAAAIHAGWRGTVGRIVSRTIEAMKQEYGTQPEDLIAGIGPGIGPTVYQIGPEIVQIVHEQLEKNHDLIQYLVSKNEHQKTPHLNLWKANYIQLLKSGIPEKNIEVAELCTFTYREDFYSARRDGAATGRLATGIMIRA
ncbi:peptidoglycan editing factor PgeF [Prolixibacter sp. NT017]|uniref:peptidoglycan editing factor PgeF n=1 Tax=Prolixibacter sp. NT017 TaxID=2652390 RepID=UPI001271237F|nr:peptidoglycan editing factor PgeF [Prolixibacter sp. NT017]GET27469.1 laccase domain protein [Prolixibacter sp. NT017]